MSPLDALREAQLYVLNHPEAIRGADAPKEKLGRLHDLTCLHASLHDEGEVARDGLEFRQDQLRLHPRRAALRRREAVERDLEGHDRTLHIEGPEEFRVNFPEGSDDVPRPELKCSGAAGMEPIRTARNDLKAADWYSERRQ